MPPADPKGRLHKLVKKQTKALGFQGQEPSPEGGIPRTPYLTDMAARMPADLGPQYNVGGVTYSGTISPAALSPKQNYDWVRQGIEAFQSGKRSKAIVGLHPVDSFHLGMMTGAAAPNTHPQDVQVDQDEIRRMPPGGVMATGPGNYGQTEFSQPKGGIFAPNIRVANWLTGPHLAQTLSHELGHAMGVGHQSDIPALTSDPDVYFDTDRLSDEASKGLFGDHVDSEALAREMNRERHARVLERYKGLINSFRGGVGRDPAEVEWNMNAPYMQQEDEVNAEFTGDFLTNPQKMRENYPFLYEEVANELEQKQNRYPNLRDAYQVVRPPGWRDFLRGKAQEMGITPPPPDPNHGPEASSLRGEFLRLRQRAREMFGHGSPASPAHTSSLVTPDNVSSLASILESEAGNGPDVEKIAVGSTVLNRLKRMGTGLVNDVSNAYATRKAPTTRSIELARNLLAGSYNDPTGGATHFYSPTSMPKVGQPTKGYDVGGGVERTPGLQVPNYRPTWAKTMDPVDVQGVDPTRFRFYKPDQQS